DYPEDQVVTLHISGVADSNTGEAITDKLTTLTDAGRGYSMKAAAAGDRLTYLLAPVSDPKAFAQKIDFGTVRRVRGRVITVVARAMEGPPPNADPVAKALYDLKSPAPFRRIDAARRLKDMMPDDSRA